MRPVIIFIIYFGISVLSLNALAMNGFTDHPAWMSDGSNADAEHLELRMGDRVFHRKKGMGRVFGFLRFFTDGRPPAFSRNSNEFDLSDIDLSFIQEVIIAPIPVILFDYRSAHSMPLVGVDPMQVFVNRGCLRHSDLRSYGYSRISMIVLSSNPPRRKICVGNDVTIDTVEDRSFSVSAVSPFTGQILLEDNRNENSTVIVQAGDVAEIPGFYEKWWCNGLARSLDYKTRGC